ncbi:MAG: PH domain-containing protein [Xanthobacteraceae bacterium]|nr:PH domain-containing protein [Xanthobacteraceae bacterium]
MIRKPAETEFRETALVNAVRESRKIAVEGGKGISKGIGRLYLLFMAVTFGFGFIVSLLAHLGSRNGFGVIVVAGLLFFAYRHFRHGAAPAAAVQALASANLNAPAERTISGAGRYELDISTVVRKTVGLAVVGGGCLYMARAGLMQVVLGGVGLVLVAAAVLHIARIFGDRTVLKFDERSVAVRGPFGERRLLWADVADIEMREAGWPRSALGLSKKYLCVTASSNHSDSPAKLEVPVDILALDSEQLVRLVSSLLYCRANADAPLDLFSRQSCSPQVSGARFFGTRVAASPPPPDLSLDGLRQIRPFGRRTSMK